VTQFDSNPPCVHCVKPFSIDSIDVLSFRSMKRRLLAKRQETSIERRIPLSRSSIFEVSRVEIFTSIRTSVDHFLAGVGLFLSTTFSTNTIRVFPAKSHPHSSSSASEYKAVNDEWFVVDEGGRGYDGWWWQDWWIRRRSSDYNEFFTHGDRYTHKTTTQARFARRYS